MTAITAVDSFSVCRPMPGEKVSGDIAMIEPFDGKLFVCLIDVAGHGPDANRLAVDCRRFVLAHYQYTDIAELLPALHEHIRYSRGAVAALGVLDPSGCALRFVGIGNIYARTFGVKSRTLTSHSGLLGQTPPSIWEENIRFEEDDLLIMCSDGISTHQLDDLNSEMLAADAKTIAEAVVRRFGKQHDDASCIVVRNGGRR